MTAPENGLAIAPSPSSRPSPDTAEGQNTRPSSGFKLPPFPRSPTEFISAQKLQFPSFQEPLTPVADNSYSAPTPTRQAKHSEASSVDTILPPSRLVQDQLAIAGASERKSVERRGSSYSVRFSSSVENLPPSGSQEQQHQQSSSSASSSTAGDSAASERPGPLPRHKSELSYQRKRSPTRDDGSIPFPTAAPSFGSTISSIQPRHSTSSQRSRPSSPGHDATHAEVGSNQPGTFSPTSSGIHARARLSSLLSPPVRVRYNSTAGPPSDTSPVAAPSQHHPSIRMPSSTRRPDGPHPVPVKAKQVPPPPGGGREGVVRHIRGSSDRSQQHRHRAAQSLSNSRASSPRDLDRERERDREREAARQAEQELWERTRGAGSSVLSLAEGDDARGRVPWTEDDVLPSLSDIQHKLHEPVEAPSSDLLLTRGIADYTILPKVLGRGKFSTVFMASRGGELSAIKHTALFPHHQLIATRLLREPTLLAELPPHPNLVEVKETIRTQGHFYLVEEFLGGYVTLEALLGKVGRVRGETRVLPLHVAEVVLAQLLSAVRAIHAPLQICHRDIKPENILVHEETLQLKLLDFGLATHFSKSDPKLTTCCGSPAFHCPEIVKALASPPGSVSYWGPDVDAWTCGVTMLRVLTGIRYPLGSSHSSLRSMAIRAQRAVTQIPLSDESGGDESLGRCLREKVSRLLEMDSVKRMKNLEEMAIERDAIAQPQRGQKVFKSTTFVPTEANHKMDLPLLTEKAAKRANTLLASPASQTGFPWGLEVDATPGTSCQVTPANSRPASPRLVVENDSGKAAVTPRLFLLNATMEPAARVMSYIKYCLRCAGILYHTWPDSKSPATLSPLTPVSSGLPMDASSPPSVSEAMFSPTTPFVPTGDRNDAWSHVQLFQCVIEYKEDEKKDEREQSSGLGFVQSIMAAFGRRPSTRRSSSQPSVSPSRAASTPSGGHGTPGAKGSATPKEAVAKTRWLTFYMVVKFPKNKRNVSRPAYSRSNTLASKRSRASSAAAETSPSTQSLASVVMPPLTKTQSLSEKSENTDTNSSASSTKSAALVQTSSTPRASTDLEIETHPDALRNLSALHSSGPWRSSTPTRSRKNSRVSKPLQNKVVIELTDERALSTIRDALSVGGTIDTSDPDETLVTSSASKRQSSVVGLAASGAGSDTARSSLSESTEPDGPSYSDQLRRSTDRATFPRGRRSQSYQGPRGGRSSGPPIPSGLKQVENISPLRSESAESLPLKRDAPPSDGSGGGSATRLGGRSAGPAPPPPTSQSARSASHDPFAPTLTPLDTIAETQQAQAQQIQNGAEEEQRGRLPTRNGVKSTQHARDCDINSSTEGPVPDPTQAPTTSSRGSDAPTEPSSTSMQGRQLATEAPVESLQDGYPTQAPPTSSPALTVRPLQ